MDPDLLTAFNLPFEEAEKFFQNKLNIPTRKWDDLWQDQHAKGFMVAGAYKADLLTDLRTAVDKIINQGATLKDFRKDFDSAVARHGWSYNGGRNWRSELIYNTNIQQAYNAGRWQQVTDPDVLQVMPYIRYRHGDSRMPRLHHLAWDGITLPPDDPWWKTHGPKNGWGCRCYVENATRREYEAAKQAGKGNAQPSPIDPKTGAPVGIDQGWDYNVGEAYLKESHDILRGKLEQWPADIGAAAMMEMMKSPAKKVIEQHYDDFITRALKADKAERNYALLGALTNEDIDFLTQKGRSPKSAGIVINDRQVVGKKAVRHQAAGNALSEEEWRALPENIILAEVALYDLTDGKVLLVAPSITDPRKIKVVVALDVESKKLDDVVNEAVTVFKVNKQALLDETRYEVIRGKVK